jgi:hypothetical protein
MPLSKALVQSFQKNRLLLGSGWRAFFAPYNIALGSAVANTTQGPKILDLQKDGPFNTNSPPSGWTDLGWIKDVRLAPASKIGNIRSGYRGAVRAKYRGEVGETFEFKFREMSRMAFKLSTGSTVFNLLDNSVASTVGPVSGSGAVAVPLHASGYQAAGAGATAGSPTLFVPAGSGSLFAVGQYVVCDVDYDGSSYGLVGSAGIPIFQGAVTDVDYIRKTSDWVGRITAISAGAVSGGDGLVLSQPLVGGGSGNPTGLLAPPVTAKVQRIKGFAAREGGTFLAEWSGLFIIDTIDGAQIAVYYPHIAIAQFRDIAGWAIENIGNTDFTGYELDCVMETLAFDDPVDGETVVAYRAFYPGGRVQDIAI